MRKCAVIVDNRPSDKLNKIIDEHMKYLQGWDCIQIQDVTINCAHHYNLLLTNAHFWEFLPYDKVLIFQHDSMMLKEIPEWMLDYDYVGAPWFDGAPWARADRRGGNGGLSIRDVQAHKELCQKVRYEARHGNEDVFFSHRLKNVAPLEVCSAFSVETEFMLGTCGYHAIEKHLTPEQCKQIKTQYEHK